MKRILFFLLTALPLLSSAQQTIKMHPLWRKPEVRVVFGQYNIYFTLKDMDKAMKLLPAFDKNIWGDSTGLDTNAVYMTELEPGRHLEYDNKLQPLIQNEIGAFLLLKGHAIIESRKHKKVTTLNANIGPVRDLNGRSVVEVEFYIPKSNTMVFSGIMWANMYHMDIDFD